MEICKTCNFQIHICHSAKYPHETLHSHSVYHTESWQNYFRGWSKNWTVLQCTTLVCVNENFFIKTYLWLFVFNKEVLLLETKLRRLSFANLIGPSDSNRDSDNIVLFNIQFKSWFLHHHLIKGRLWVHSWL